MKVIYYSSFDIYLGNRETNITHINIILMCVKMTTLCFFISFYKLVTPYVDIDNNKSERNEHNHS